MTNKNYKTVMMNSKDKVAVALTKIEKGTTVEVNCENQLFAVTLMDELEFGHKFAVLPIKRGEDILKYGEVIGVANRDISPGEHVHIHNLDGKRGRGDKLVKQQETKINGV
ncbi:altronate dehydratase small subunit [Evansella vedderi]|uniref:Altronate dehydratase small subunit n=1 Tax=Evansella vedderi TaxID=38282 RepID=A0ABU0A1I3_9BACI|nr:UxaA family hydrolase [Evansella vedderi]MDQ0257339.1 altronate dehydratase small subunit [Evansella vedderi]